MRLTTQRQGFSLVLSLTVMALMVLVVLSIAGFLNIESRLAAIHQAGTQARLSAVASLRLAIGHLQQETGPDRRVTARADLTADTTQPNWTWATIRNPLWTGVWRSDRPDQPPSWLVSGRHDMPAGAQSVSLSSGPAPAGSPYTFVDYNSSHWLPWQSDYTVTTAQTAGANIVTLVGDATATAAETATATDPGRPDGRISLPAIASPDTATTGLLPRGTGLSYAYWIGDEGIKAKANLGDDTRLARSLPSGLLPARGTGRNGMEILAGFEGTATATSVTPGSAFARLGGHADLPLLSGFSNTPVAPVPATAIPNRRCRPDVTFWSTGILADSLWGGLRIDLSQVFEQSDSAFINGEFGEGEGSTTLLFWQMSKTTRADPPIMGILGVGKIWQPMWWCDPTGVTGVPNIYPTRYDIAPIYTHNWDDPDNAAGRSGGNPQIRGPTWMIIRDYHRLYRQMSWTGANPTIRARTVFPNVVSNEKMQSGTGGTYHYSHIFNRMDNTNFSTLYGDPFAADVSTGPFGGSKYENSKFAGLPSHAGVPTTGYTPCIRPVKVASTPYIARQMLMFGLQQATGQLRIVLSPVTVLHNPYNVAVNLQRENPADTAAMRLSFRQWNSWSFTMTCPSVNSGLSWSKTLEQLTKASDSSAYSGENMRTYLPEIVLQPGEFRVFSPNASAPVPFTRIATASNSYDFLGGFWVPCLTPSDTTFAPAATDSFSIGFNTAGSFYARHLMSCWPGDSIMEPATGSDAMYNRCSEHTELFDSQLNPARNGSAGSITYPVGGVMTQVPGVGSPPRLFAVVDYTVRWPRDPLPYPILTHSNPLALMTRGDATGWSPGGGNARGDNIGTGFATTSPSYRLSVSGGATWSTAFEAGDAASRLGLGGASVSPGLGGQTSAVLTELPMHPPTSIAQYAHANFGMRDQDPLFCIGSSFASPNVPLDKVVHYRASENWTDVDRAYLANLAVWDRYFLSSASPEPTPPAQPVNVMVNDNFGGLAPPWSLLSGTPNDRARPLATVLDDFVAGTYPLLNPRMRIWDGRNRTAMSTTAPTRTDLAVRLGDYRQTAAHLVVDGAFNINSTSVDAWAAVLAGTKRIAMGSDTANQPATNRNARYPRATRAGAAAGDPRAGWTSANAWTGYAALDDAQLRLLARAIVDEIRFRTQYAVRTPHDRQLRKGGLTEFPERRFRGATTGSTVLVPTPFLGLSQFVNRFLDTTSPANAVAKSGCLQSAIARAESDGGEITNRASPAAEVNQGSLADRAGGAAGLGQQSWSPSPVGIEIADAGTRSGLATKASKNQTHAALFAPGSVLQHDILAAIGPNINARSDTFVIRAYAEVRGQGTSDTARGRAWVEAVVQRTPDYIRHRESAASASLGESTASASLGDTPEANPPTHGVNLALGRRYRVISVRWMGPSEL